MTNSDIRKASDNGYSNWEILAMLVNEGAEFPNASATVANALRLPKDEVAEMEHDYDTCC